MKNNRFAKKIICVFFAVLLLVSSVPAVAGAEDKIYPFDQVHVQKDLESIDGFSYLQYPYDPTGFRSPQIFNVVEFAYSYRANLQDDYALYLYFYNPQALNIDATSNQNKVVMAVEYDNYPITQDSAPTAYETFDLAFCSRSTGDYENLFYKFRVVDHESADGKTMLERVNSNGRRYDISEVLLKTVGQDNAAAYGVGGTYYFTGYAKGYGSDVNAESTLTCDVLDLETVELEVKSTYFRTQSSSLGAGHQNQLNTVYFGVPDELLEKYGKLQKVKAEWYEYKTKPIYVTTDTDAYQSFKQHIGEFVGSTYSPVIGFGMGFGYKQTGTDVTTFSYDNAFNVHKKDGILSNEVIYNYIDTIYYIFQNDKIEAGETVVTGEELEQYIKDYGPGTAQLPVKNGTISADLFEDDIDENRKIDNEHGKIQKGFSYYEIDANDKFDMLSYNESHSFWDKLFDYGIFSKDTTDDTYKALSPIYAVTAADLQKDADALSSSLLIDKTDVADFKAYAAAAEAKDQTTHLFRFAQTDYYSEIGRTTTKDKFSGIDNGKRNTAMRAQQTVFYDFTVISLTFSKDGVYKVIPAASSPIDVINDVTGPTNDGSSGCMNFLNMIGAWGVLILSIIIGLVILIIEFKIFDLILKIQTKAVRIIVFILILALFIYLDYLAVDFVIQTIEGLGGLT